jgi:hypothetical protein
MIEYLGNTDLLKLHKTAFLCSQKCPAQVVLKSFDWAKQQREAGNCIVCGNHSQIEKDVFEILLKGKQPLILVLARGMKSSWESPIENAVKTNRLLIISAFDKEVKRVTRETAEMRNKEIIEMSDQLVAGYISPGGQLYKRLGERAFDLL